MLFCSFVFQIGHVTKSGDLAGPHVLEHIVDVVLYMEVGTLLPFLFLHSCGKGGTRSLCSLPFYIFFH